MTGVYMKCNIGLKWVNSVFSVQGKADSLISDGETQRGGNQLTMRLGLHILHFSFNISVLYQPNIWSFNIFKLQVKINPKG